jgi:hypothetical protein
MRRSMILLPLLLALQEIDLLMIGVLVSSSGVSASDLAAALPAEEMDPRLLLEPDEKPMETYEMMGRLVRGPLTDSSPGLATSMELWKEGLLPRMALPRTEMELSHAVRHTKLVACGGVLVLQWKQPQ